MRGGRGGLNFAYIYKYFHKKGISERQAILRERALLLPFTGKNDHEFQFKALHPQQVKEVLGNNKINGAYQLVFHSSFQRIFFNKD